MMMANNQIGISNESGFYNKMETIIGNAVNESYLSAKDVLTKFEWNTARDLNILLDMYTQLINESSIKVCVVEVQICEAIIVAAEEDTSTVHIVNLDFIKQLFNVYCSQQNLNVQEMPNDQTNTVYELPQIITVAKPTVIRDHLDIEKITPPHPIMAKLVFLYVLADHAAYHYSQFIKYKDFDFKHLRIQRNAGFCEFLHDLITTEPNEHIQDYITTKQEMQKHPVKIHRR